MIRSVFARNPRDRALAFRSRTWLDGIEVTAECQIAICDEPDEAGAVLLLKRNRDGRYYAEAGELAREWKRGHVTITP